MNPFDLHWFFNDSETAKAARRFKSWALRVLPIAAIYVIGVSAIVIGWRVLGRSS